MYALPALRQALYDAALCAAFWIAVWQLRAAPVSGWRAVGGLALGALFARAGGLLFVPAGLLLAAPGRKRAEFLDATLPSLPFAFATAKLGCIAAACCPWAAAEALGFAALGAALRGAPARGAGALALAGLGAVRLAVLPLRPEAALSLLPAAVWLTLAALRCRPSDGGDPCPRPGSATSSRTASSSRPGCAGSSLAPKA